MPNIIYTIIAIRLFQTRLAHRSFLEMLKGLEKTPAHDHLTQFLKTVQMWKKRGTCCAGQAP